MERIEMDPTTAARRKLRTAEFRLRLLGHLAAAGQMPQAEYATRAEAETARILIARAEYRRAIADAGTMRELARMSFRDATNA
jgi:hypothetical protein